MMRLFFLPLVLLCLLLSSKMQAGEIILSGTYYGKNLIVSNPSYDGDFCVVAVKINGVQTSDEIRSNAFFIDFAQSGIEEGQSVEVSILHRDGCLPEILNPSVISPDRNLTFEYAKFDRNTQLTWEISGILGDGPFYVQQYRWNQWSNIKEVAVNDTVSANTYAVDVILHSGQNQFRIMRYNASGEEVTSKIAKYYNSRVPKVTLKSTKTSSTLVFSAETIYEIYDLSGERVAEGFAQEVDISSLEKGMYYLNYDVSTTTIKKK